MEFVQIKFSVEQLAKMDEILSKNRDQRVEIKSKKFQL